MEFSASDLAIAALVERYAPDRQEIVVDCGSGSGRQCRLLSSRGYRRIVALDVDPWAHDQVTGIPGVEFRLVDRETPLIDLGDHAAGCVVLTHVIEHIQNPGPLLAEVSRVLAPDRTCCIVTPDFARAWKTFYSDPSHVRPYVMESLVKVLDVAGFDVVDRGHVNVRRPFGRFPILWKRIRPLMYSGNALYAIARARGSSGRLTAS